MTKAVGRIKYMVWLRKYFFGLPSSRKIIPPFHTRVIYLFLRGVKT